MKRLSLELAAIAASLLAFSGCDEVENTAEISIPDAASQELFTQGVNFSANGDLTATVSFTSSLEWSAAVEEVEVTKAPSWLTVSPISGPAGPAEITITAQENSDEKERTAKVTITCGDISKSLGVTQQGVQPEPSVPVTSITLDRTEAEMTIGETLLLFPTILPDDARDKTITWSSSSPKVASVAGETIPDVTGIPIPVGKVTALGEGETIITAKAGEKEAKCKIIVGKGTVAVAEIKLNKDNLELEPGKTEQLTVTVMPENATDKTVTWSTSAEKVATVKDGLVTAVSEGEAVISAKAGEKEASCKVIVKAGTVAVTSIELNKTSLEMEPGKTEQLIATVKPDNATDKTVTWSTSNEKVAYISKGGAGADGSTVEACVVIAKTEGEATITAKAGDKAATCKVVVKDNTVAVTSVVLNKTSIELAEGSTEQLTATVKPDNATDKTVTWSTSNSTYVTVDNTGKVTAVKAGEATITATASGKTADCKVTVTVEEVVDLGLSVKWRAWNVGATKPIEYGDYFGWGETEPYYTGLSYGNNSGLDANGWKSGKSYGYNWRSNKHRTSGFNAYEEGTNHLIVSKYNTQEGNGPVDNKTVLDAEDDPASVILGGGWRTPTNAEWQELLDNCTIEYIKAYDFLYKEGSNPGFAASAMKFTSKKNGKSIIIPLAGYFMNEYLYYWNAYYGFYWSSSMPTSYIPEGSDGKEWAPAVAWMCYMKNTEAHLSCFDRCNGMTVRPVKD